MADVMVKLLPLDKVTELLGCSIYTVRRYIALESIEAVRIGTRVMVSEAEVQRLQREGLVALPLGRPKKKAVEVSDREQKPRARSKTRRARSVAR
jgi:excisionase family DNA binding protein